MTRFIARYRCAACTGELRYDEVMDSGGVCPLCGAVSEGRIVAAVKTAVPIGPRPPSPPPVREEPIDLGRRMDWRPVLLVLLALAIAFAGFALRAAGGPR